MKKISSGFTLIELMVVVVIVAVLASVAYPSYQESVMKSRRSTAMGDLQSLGQAMERHFNANDTYVGSGAVGGAPTIFPSESPLDGNTKYYDLTLIALSGTGYTIRATPKGAQAGDGIIQLTSIGVRSWDEDNDGAFAATETDWERD